MYKVRVRYDQGQGLLQLEQPHFDLQGRDGQVEWVFENMPKGHRPVVNFRRERGFRKRGHGPFSELVSGQSRVYGIDNQGGRELYRYSVSLLDDRNEAPVRPVLGSFWNDYDPAARTRSAAGPQRLTAQDLAQVQAGLGEWRFEDFVFDRRLG